MVAKILREILYKLIKWMFFHVNGPRWDETRRDARESQKCKILTSGEIYSEDTDLTILRSSV